jgi:hypothetical protein
MASMSVTTTRPPRVVAARFTFCIERLGRWGAFLYCNNDIVAVQLFSSQASLIIGMKKR